MSLRGSLLLILIASLLGLFMWLWFVSAPAPAPLVPEPAVSEGPSEPPAEPEYYSPTDEDTRGEPDLSFDPLLARGGQRAPLAPIPDGLVQVSGIVVDSFDKQPLPEFRIDFEVLGQDEALPVMQVTTDAQGKFKLPTSIPAARVLATFIDTDERKRHPAPWTLEPHMLTRPLELSIASGPTFRIMVLPQSVAGQGDLEVRLRIGSTRTRENHVSEWLPLREGNPPWVRFGPVPISCDKPERLEVRTRDGLWEATQVPPCARGIAPSPIGITLESRAKVEGRVLDSAGEPVEGMELVLTGLMASGLSFSRETKSDSDGRYRFGHLPGCQATIQTRSLRFEPWEKALPIVVGNSYPLDITVGMRRIAGPIRVRVESESGTYEPHFTLKLTPDRPDDGSPRPGSERSGVGQWKSVDGRKIAFVEFPDLPVDVYRLSIDKQDWFQWDPPVLKLQPPIEEARIRILDSIPHADLAVRAIDRSSGQIIVRGTLTLEFAGGKQAARQYGDNITEPLLRDLPIERKLFWRLDVPGYAPATGDERAFNIEERWKGRSTRVAEIELTQGFGEVYRFQSEQNRRRKPAAGVIVWHDGRQVGVSNEKGECHVSVPFTPRLVQYSIEALGYPEPVPLVGTRKDRFYEVTVPVKAKSKPKAGQ
jgi:5-hydroxyisourate hydrolase-like protein (transthyretin family)